MGIVGLVVAVSILARALVVGGGGGSCDVYEGRWKYDESYPLYNTSRDCHFIEQLFDCQKNGRPDQFYLKLRWQPNSCNLPRSSHPNSLNLSHLPQAYNVTIMLLRNGFLVDIANYQKIQTRVLKLDSIVNGNAWKGNDILIFNSWHWWLHSGTKQSWNYIRDGNRIYKDMNRLLAFEKGLRTWARWINSNINPNKTRVFFQDISPDHANASAWGDREGKGCLGQLKPVAEPPYPGGPHPAEAVVKRVLRSMSVPVHLLEITRLSQLRKDGHPSIYGFRSHASDCSHWCLPGVPDTWNQLLFAALVGN